MLESLVGLLMQAEVMKAQIEVQETVDSYYVAEAGNASGHVVEVTYDVDTLGDVKGDLGEFKDVVGRTLTDSRGWIRAGVKFTAVETGGTMHVYLAEPTEVAKASAGCSADLSCTVKPNVYINDERWRNASDSYNALNVNLANYRQMVINHEVGHFLGHDHITACETQSGLAPVMLQQSTGLLGCQPNYWPLPTELWTKGL